MKEIGDGERREKRRRSVSEVLVRSSQVERATGLAMTLRRHGSRGSLCWSSNGRKLAELAETTGSLLRWRRASVFSHQT